MIDFESRREDETIEEYAERVTKWAQERTRRKQEEVLDRAPKESIFGPELDLTPRTKGKIPLRPGSDTPLAQKRQWLSHVLPISEGGSIFGFRRHGRQDSDRCDLEIITKSGSRQIIEIAQFRDLAPARLRDTIIDASDGLIIPLPVSRNEATDIRIMLMAIGEVLANHTINDETEEWVDSFRAFADHLTGYSFKDGRKIAAMQYLAKRQRFDKQNVIHHMHHEGDDATRDRRVFPIILDDEVTGEQWAKVGEFGVYVREMQGALGISWASLTARIAAIGGHREKGAFRVSRSEIIKYNLYRLPEEWSIADPGDAPE